jgi:hypothetical protein
MPDGVNTAMNTVQASGGEAACNTGWGKTGPSELVGCHDAVLPGCNARDRGVGGGFVAFLSHIEKKSTNAPFSLP